ncbi:MAG: DEAD/DEAH box helicase [Planctomycetota bacterium]|jgi:superfamily II RNA helicase
MSILAHIPDATGSDDLLAALLEYCEETGIEPYGEQLDAFEAIAEDKNVVLSTPTGSGKSLVALGAHFVAHCRGDKSIYTAPIKALVNEKFFDLCRAFGPENVGLMTGDATVNRDAPMICCTAEILAKMALGEGARTPYRWVVMDEFHFYSDPQRGMAWLIPLVEMTDSRFLLMSATLREPQAIADDIERRTGHDAVVVSSDTRPVPLEFEYRDTLLLETISHVRLDGITPAYLVSFTKRDAATLASQLRSTPVADSLKETIKQRRTAINEAIEGRGFDTPFGQKLKALLPHGIAVHHGGMLPKYRRLVERLAGQGLVTLVCGTDTLGVGVNLPLRTVIFTQLYKFDGTDTRLLSSREFRQIAGRAGRKGHDDVGTVIIQAPEHEVVNRRKKAKAAASSKKFHAESPPKGFKGWNEKTFEKLRTGRVDPLVTRFWVSGLLVLQALARPGDGHAALAALIRSVGGDVEANLKRADEIIESLEAGGMIERLDAPDDEGRLYAVRQSMDVTFDRPLAPFLESALGLTDRGDPEHALNVVSIVESVLDDPPQVLRAQTRHARNALYAELRAADPQSLEDRNAMQEELEAVEHPQPLGEEIAVAFRAWCERFPWLADQTPSPKSVVRDLYECGDTFGAYVRRLEIVHDEGTLLRYLSDAYRVLSKHLPDVVRTEEVASITEWLGAIVHRVDSSVVAEWERFDAGDGRAVTIDEDDDVADEHFDVTRAVRGFRVMVRNVAFGWIKALAERREADIGVDPGTMAPYWERYEEILVTPAARGPENFEYDHDGGAVTQTILDPHDERQWIIRGTVDLDASRAEGRAVARVVAVGPRVDLADRT